MAYTRALDVVIAILLLVILSVALLVASLLNIKSFSYDSRQVSIGSFEKISDALKIPYAPTKIKPIGINLQQRDEESRYSSAVSLTQDSCKKNSTNCIIDPPDPEKENEEDIYKYDKACILKDKYIRLCRHL